MACWDGAASRSSRLPGKGAPLYHGTTEPLSTRTQRCPGRPLFAELLVVPCPERSHFLQLVRMLNSQVVRLRAVLGEVVQFPRRSRATGNDLPIADAQGAVPLMLKKEEAVLNRD